LARTEEIARPDGAGGVVVEFDVEARMRDGVVLRANLGRPAGEGRWPVILIRTPYGKDGPLVNFFVDYPSTAREGFVVILQDCRHRFKSGGDGEFEPWVNEARDGADSIEWAARLPFSTGDVFTMGTSYNGFVQWAAAVEQPPSLRAIAPTQAPGLPRRALHYRGGVFELGMTSNWYVGVSFDTVMRRHRNDPATMMGALRKLMADAAALPQGGFEYLPLSRFEALASNNVGGQFFEILAAGGEPTSPTAKALTEAQDFSRVTAPALIVAGWYDYFIQGSVEQYTGMRSAAGSAEARERTRLIVGPWGHGPLFPIIGERNFGIAAAPSGFVPGGLTGETLRFFMEQLADKPSNVPPVKIFVMGANTWRDEYEWPLARTQVTPWYLSSNGHANGLTGDGVIGPEPKASPPDSFSYDPARPVPEHGGNATGIISLAGPRDQRVIEAREDVLVYTSQPLEEDLEVTGSAIVELWAVSSAVDTDFVVRLVDVQADGIAYNIAEGVLRGRHRADPDAPGAGPPLTPGEPCLFRIELTPTSNLFKRGNRLRLDVTSSCFPRWARNLNIWDQSQAALADAEIAHQQILHDALHPSRVLLPVVPADK
jgi:putative CocE/NonD family hydrolase